MNILLKEAIRRYGHLSTKPNKPVVNRGGSHTIPNTDIPQTQRGVRYLVKELIKSHISKMNPTK